MIDHPSTEHEVRSRDLKPSPESLTGLLLASLAGQVETACRFAGRACVALRHSDPNGEHGFNALLHRLTPRLPW